MKLLGRIELVDGDGRSVDAVLRQPKRLALLSHLVLSPGPPIRRYALLSLFWPGLDDRRARRALSQALHHLGRALGEGVLLGGRTETLSVAPGRVACDVHAFQATLTAGELADALGFYSGELLPGFVLEGCPDWQDWLDKERTRLASVATAAALTLARREEAAGDQHGTVAWAQRAAALSRFEEGPVREAMRLMADAGERAAALREYERLVRWLREALDAEPDEETNELAAELRAAGKAHEAVPSVRAIPIGFGAASVQVKAPSDDLPFTEAHADAVHSNGSQPSARSGHEAPALKGENGAETASAEIALDSARLSPRTPDHAAMASVVLRRKRAAGVLIAAVLLLLLAGSKPAQQLPAQADQEMERVSIAVLPFGELGSTPDALGHLAAVLTLTISDRLAQVPSFEVRPVAQFPRAGRDGLDAAGYAPGVVLTGALLAGKSELRVRYGLVDVRTKVLLWADTLELPVADSLTQVDEAARAISAAVRVEIGRRARSARWADDAPYGGARRLLEEADWLRQRARALNKAGSVLATRRALAARDSVLAVAAKVAPEWVEPWIQRARTAESQGWLEMLASPADLVRQEVAWRRGIAFASRAIMVNPGEPRAWETRGILREFLWGTLISEARPNDAILDSVVDDLQRAISLDRFLPRSWATLSAALSTRGRLAEAAEAAQEALAVDRYLEDRQEVLLRLYETSLDLGNDSAAVRWCAEAGRRDSASVTWASCTLGLLAWSKVPPVDGITDPWRILHAVRDTSPLMRSYERELEIQVAAVLARRGERDSARAVIRRAVRTAGPMLPPPLLRLQALALATAGDRAAADSAANAFARYDPAAGRRLRQSRAFELLVRQTPPQHLQTPAPAPDRAPPASVMEDRHRRAPL